MEEIIFSNNKNRKKNNIINIRVSDDFLDNINEVIEIMEKEFNETVTVSEVIRRLAVYAFVLIFKRFSASDFLRTLSQLYTYKCNNCGWRCITNEFIKVCPKCGSKVERERFFIPDNRLLEITKDIPLTKIIEIMEK